MMNVVKTSPIVIGTILGATAVLFFGSAIVGGMSRLTNAAPPPADTPQLVAT